MQICRNVFNFPGQCRGENNAGCDHCDLSDHYICRSAQIKPLVVTVGAELDSICIDLASVSSVTE